MDMLLRDRVALITGGASGIGLACVEALIREGARVVIVDRSYDGADVADGLKAKGHDVEFVQADVSKEADVRRCVEAASRRFGQLDMVIACAGVSGPVGVSTEHVTAEQTMGPGDGRQRSRQLPGGKTCGSPVKAK